MANKMFSFNKMIRAAQLIDAAQRRAQREELRLQNERIRQYKAMEKEKSIKKAPVLTKETENKSISLLDGSNLLHLLEKHGFNARIDIYDAKRVLAQR